jgi:hypothetical protein
MRQWCIGAVVFFQVAQRVVEKFGGGAAQRLAPVEAAWPVVGPILEVPKVKGAAALATSDGFVHVVGRALLLLESDEAPLPLAEYRTFGEPCAGGRGAWTLRSDAAVRVYRLRAGQEPIVAALTTARSACTISSTSWASASCAACWRGPSPKPERA